MARYAMCIGNDDYTILSKLSSAVADAKAISEKVASLGFVTEFFYDLKNEDMIKVIGTLEEKIKEFDSVLFYFAGHGFEIDGNNILASVDLNTNNDKKVIIHDAYKVQELMDLLELGDDKINPKTKIIILDACRERLGGRGGYSCFAPILAPQGSIIAFSTSPGQVAKERNGHGIYTATLLKYMGLPRVSIEHIFKCVRNEMVKVTNGQQIPWEHTSLIGDFYLNAYTIYESVSYKKEALQDELYEFRLESKIKPIVDGLRIRHSVQQRDGLREFNKISTAMLQTISQDELFILGRYIYRAANSGCLDCQDFINGFSNDSHIPDVVKFHILNGMAFDIYFDSKGNMRKRFEITCSSMVLKLLETEEFYGSQLFINSFIENDISIFYTPGQHKKVVVDVYLKKAEKEVIAKIKEKHMNISDVFVVSDIKHDGSSIYLNKFCNKKINHNDLKIKIMKSQFEKRLERDMVIAEGYLQVCYPGYDIENKTDIIFLVGDFQVFPN